ncbi:MAG: hypothetical protein WCF06_04370 [Nitrososphaeraceae archaeon]
MSLNDTTESNMEDNTVNPRSGVTLKNIEVKLPGEFALSEALRYYSTGTRSRNKSERLPRITIRSEAT